MRIDTATVFGGTGFLGRYVVRRLAREGARVTVAIRRPEEAKFLKTMGGVGQITPLATNIRDEATVQRAVEGADAVINAVGILYESGPQTFAAVHVEGAARIARAAQAAGVRRLVHVSAIGADAASSAAYGRSKAAGEKAVSNAFPGAAIMRPSLLFGPEDKFFNRFAAMAMLSPVLPLIGGGHTRFQPVYACDVADAIGTALALDGPPPPRPYELGGPQVYSFRRLMEIMLAEIGQRRLLVPVPFWLATAEALWLERLPMPLLTRDQVRMLRSDNVVSAQAPGIETLGITPTALEAILPGYLRRFRRGAARRRLAQI
jgi:uncharacterized protein YbjT (DUF2867 family)